MEGKTTPSRGLRRDHPPRNVQPKQHDPYATRRRRKATLVCDRCGVVNHAGRWAWGVPPTGPVESGLCPACRRVEDRYPAGTIRIHRLDPAERDEIRNLIANVVERERKEHPLERVMEIADDGGDLVVTTTGLHAARCVTGALRRRYKKGVAIRYAEEQKLVTVDVTR